MNRPAGRIESDEATPGGSPLGVAVKNEAACLGFELVGIAPAVTPTGLHDFVDWVERGFAGQMEYIERREEAYSHPRHVLDGVRSVIMLGLNYNTQPGEATARRRDEPVRSAKDRK